MLRVILYAVCQAAWYTLLVANTATADYINRRAQTRLSDLANALRDGATQVVPIQTKKKCACCVNPATKKTDLQIKWILTKVC